MVLALVLGPSAADAATQSRDDPSDAPGPASGKADLRRVAWDVTGSAATLTVSLDDNAFAPVAVHVLMDTGGDGLADEEVVATRNVDGKRVDVKLRELSHALSTADCQDLAGKNTSAQGTVSSTTSGGLETFAFTFDPTVVAGGLASFRWAAFGQAPDFNGAWDLLPDAANPDPAAPNPGDRRCDGAKSGLAVRMAAGVEFPDPAPPQPTPTASPTATPAAPPPKPVVVLDVPSGQPQAGGIATIDAHGTIPPPGTHIVAYEWDVDGDHHVDANTGTNPIFHLPAGSAAQTVIVTAIDSNFGSGSAATSITPGPSPSHCDSEASIRILRIRAACITRTGQVTRASGTPSNRYWNHYVIDLNGLSLVTLDPSAYVTFDEAHDEIVGHGDFRVMSLNAPAATSPGTRPARTASAGRCPPARGACRRWPRSASPSTATTTATPRSASRSRAASRSPARSASASTRERWRRCSTSRRRSSPAFASRPASACAPASRSAASRSTRCASGSTTRPSAC